MYCFEYLPFQGGWTNQTGDRGSEVQFKPAMCTDSANLFRSNTLSGRTLDARRHYVIWAKALDGIFWPVGEAPPRRFSAALHSHDQLAKYHPVPWPRWHNVSWHQVFRLPEGWASIFPEIWHAVNEWVRWWIVFQEFGPILFDMSSASGYMGAKINQEFSPIFFYMSLESPRRGYFHKTIPSWNKWDIPTWAA